jgi:probable F420-dependent oxidoreductase
MTALMAAANATTSLRLASHVLANDFRPPVLLSDGRLEFGIGSGWFRSDYEVCGIALDPPAVRIRRLAEAVLLIKGLFGDEPVTFTGEFYRVKEFTLQPKPKQRPHPPFYIGGGGRQVLTLAAQAADIVGLDAKGTWAGTKDMATITAEPLAQQIEWVRQAAGPRFD